MHEIQEIPWKELFQYEIWRKEYKKHLKPEEDVDFLGTPGNFKMKDSFSIAILIEGNYHPDFKTQLHEHIPNLDQNFDHFNVKNQIFHVLSTFFADKLKKLPSSMKNSFPEGTSSIAIDIQFRLEKHP